MWAYPPQREARTTRRKEKLACLPRSIPTGYRHPAFSSPTAPSIRGTLNSSINDDFRIDFYSTDELLPSGYGVGEVYLGFVDVTTNASGNASFTFTPATAVPVGQYITAIRQEGNRAAQLTVTSGLT